MCFMDVTKAFDRIRLQNVLYKLRKNNIFKDIIHAIRKQNINTKKRIRNNNKFEKIDTPTGNYIGRNYKINKKRKHMIPHRTPHSKQNCIRRWHRNYSWKLK